MNKPNLEFCNRLSLRLARYPAKLIFLAIVANAFSSLAADELRWKLAAGERFQAELTLTSSTLSEYETRASNLSQETRLEISWKVREVTDGLAVIEEKIERIFMQLDAPVSNPGNKIYFDTSDPTGANNFQAEQAKLLNSMVGATFIVRMRDNGAIESAECTPETLAKIQAAPANAGVRELISPEAITKLFADSTIAFPADEKTAKDGWSMTEANESSWGRLETERRYALVGEEQVDSRPQLKFTGDFKTAIPSPKTEDGSTPVAEQSTLKLLKGNGAWFFDPAAGIITSGESSLQIDTERTYREEKLKSSYRHTVNFRLRKMS